MGDHTESLQVEFDSSIISYQEILSIFWSNHNSNRENYRGRQYISLLLYHNENQKETILQIKRELEERRGEEIQTEAAPFHRFNRAEDYHQKYYLKRYPNAMKQLETIFPSEQNLVNSTLAARLNGFVKGFGNLGSLKEEIKQWPIDETARQKQLELLKKMKW